MDLDLSISNGIVLSKIYDERDDFNFEIDNFWIDISSLSFLRCICFASNSFWKSMSKCKRLQQLKPIFDCLVVETGLSTL